MVTGKQAAAGIGILAGGILLGWLLAPRPAPVTPGMCPTGDIAAMCPAGYVPDPNANGCCAPCSELPCGTPGCGTVGVCSGGPCFYCGLDSEGEPGCINPCSPSCPNGTCADGVSTCCGGYCCNEATGGLCCLGDPPDQVCTNACP